MGPREQSSLHQSATLFWWIACLLVAAVPLVSQFRQQQQQAKQQTKLKLILRFDSWPTKYFLTASSLVDEYIQRCHKDPQFWTHVPNSRKQTLCRVAVSNTNASTLRKTSEVEYAVCRENFKNEQLKSGFWSDTNATVHELLVTLFCFTFVSWSNNFIFCFGIFPLGFHAKS